MIALIITGFCSFIFIAVGIFAMNREKPMWFWAGSEDEVEKETIVNVKEYNRKNGWMWILYGIMLFFPAIVALIFDLPEFVYVFLFVGILVFGMISMMLYYEHLHDVYTQKK